MLLVMVAAGLAVAMIAWVGIDSARRGRNWLGWSMATAFFAIFGLLVWLLRRPGVDEPHPIAGPQRLRIALTAPLLFGLSVIVVTWLTAFVVQAGRVEGAAMAPTLIDGDRVIVDKMVYRYRMPRTGEIVMLYYPLDPDRVLVMRVAGEEGDQIRIQRGRVFCNDVPRDEPFVAAEYRSNENWGPQIVPEGYYFVLADRRDGGVDSRHWKYVPRKYILGRIALRWWPMSQARSF